MRSTTKDLVRGTISRLNSLMVKSTWCCICQESRVHRKSELASAVLSALSGRPSRGKTMCEIWKRLSEWKRW